jgi:mannose-6-phosphate isomerase-like protein (cupin superfamily)
MKHPVNILEQFARIDEYWSPHILSELNGQQLKLAKVKGDFVWHDHAGEDELFLIYRGTLHLDFRDRPTVTLKTGEFFVVPRGVEHRPRTDDGQEVWLLLLEPAATKHTGAVENERTVKVLKRL